MQPGGLIFQENPEMCVGGVGVCVREKERQVRKSTDF